MSAPFPITRPLIAFDTETTGIDTSTARIVELAFHKYWPDGREQEFHAVLNPGILIPPNATAVHGITDDDVEGKPRFEDIAPRIAAAFTDVDYVGYHVGYDLDVLEEEFARSGIAWTTGDARIVDGLALWQALYPRTLSDFYRTFASPEERDRAHSAQDDTEAAIEGVRGLLALHANLDTSVEHLASLRRGGLDRNGCIVLDAEGVHPVWSVGKYRGVRVEDLDEGFCRWVQRSSFSRNTKRVLKELRDGRYA